MERLLAPIIHVEVARWSRITEHGLHEAVAQLQSARVPAADDEVVPSRQLCRGRQGNRVKKSCDNETCEEVVVPGGDLAFGAEARLAGSLTDQIVSDVL